MVRAHRNVAAAGYCILEHQIQDSYAFLGHVDTPTSTLAEARTADWVFRSAGYYRKLEGADGLGLIQPALFVDGAPTCLLIQAELHVGPAVNWTLYLTSGFRDGDAADTVDDPANDLQIAAGTGNTLLTELLVRVRPDQGIRVVSGATNRGASGTARVILSFATAVEGATDVPVV